jgi:hypothetical protein
MTYQKSIIPTTKKLTKQILKDFFCLEILRLAVEFLFLPAKLPYPLHNNVKNTDHIAPAEA